MTSIIPHITEFERALETYHPDSLPSPIGTVVDADEAPDDFIPFLAGHESVDLWYPDWSDDRKREMIADAPKLASLVGTRAAAQRFLDYVDAEIIHKVSHPANKPIGLWAVGVDPFNHPPHTARYLVKVDLAVPAAAFCAGRDPVGYAAVIPIDLEPLDRAMTALALSKAEHTTYTINFAHRRRVTLDDGLDLDAGYEFGEFTDRVRL